MGEEDSFEKDFEWALKNGDIDQVQISVNKNRTLVGKVLPNGRYPLCVAADYGQTEVIQLLLTAGAEVDVSDRYGITPLLSAIYEGHTECVRILLKRGANKRNIAPDGTSLIGCAEKEEIKELLR